MNRPGNLLELLRREAEFQRQRGGEEDSAELARYFEMAVAEIEELRTEVLRLYALEQAVRDAMSGAIKVSLG